MLIKKFIICLLSFLAITYQINIFAKKQNEFSANMTQTQKLIFQIAFTGKMTKTLHDQFWATIPDIEKAAISKYYKELIATPFNKAYEYQREYWKCVLFSYRLREPVKTIHLIELQKFFVEGKEMSMSF